MRIHSTSIGAPRSSDAKPARSRSVECRPSQPTTSSARMSSVALRHLGAHADDAAVLLDQIGRLRVHAQVEGWISLAVRGKEV